MAKEYIAKLLHLPRQISSKGQSDVFLLFSQLPSELRLKIWTYYLDDPTPQMYRFSLRYPQRYDPRDVGLDRIQPGDHLFLQPTQLSRSNGPSKEYEFNFQSMREATNLRLTASLVCVESRQAVLDRYPDIIPFRLLPQNWGWVQYDNSEHQQLLDGSRFPDYALRFHASKDIIIFDANWDAQEFAVKISKSKGFLPSAFLKIRHVGISLHNIDSAHQEPRSISRKGLRYGTWKCEDDCSTEACEDFCKYEPLPEFLTLFPRLENFYLADIPRSSTHSVSYPISKRNAQTRNDCPCPIEGPRHFWPIIRSGSACGWFVVYDERSECQFLELDRIKELRQRWRPWFPYYQALGHLNIRFIQPLPKQDVKPCDDCVFERWKFSQGYRKQ